MFAFRSTFGRLLAVALLLALGLALLGARPSRAAAEATTALNCSGATTNTVAEEPPDPCQVFEEVVLAHQPFFPPNPIAAFCRALGEYPPQPFIPLRVALGELPPDPCAT